MHIPECVLIKSVSAWFTPSDSIKQNNKICTLKTSIQRKSTTNRTLSQTFQPLNQYSTEPLNTFSRITNEPHTITDISTIESVQHRTTKYILKDYKCDYKQWLIASSLLPLMYWLDIQDILFWIKYLHLPQDSFKIHNHTAPTWQGSGCKLQYKFKRTNTTWHFYWCWTVLPVERITSIRDISLHLKIS